MIERDRPLRLDTRFVQTVLTAAQHGHREMRHRVVCTAREDFTEQFFNARLIILWRVAPPFDYRRHQDCRQPDPRLYGLRISSQRPFEGPLRILQDRHRPRPVKQRPTAHYEIVRIGIGRLFLLDPAAYRLHEFEVQRPGQMPDDLLLGFREIFPFGLEPFCPHVAPGFGVDQLYIHPDPAG